MLGLAQPQALPMYVWLVALPQLCSRLTHPHPDTATLTRNIITRVFMEYPQQVGPKLRILKPHKLPNPRTSAPLAACASAGDVTV